MGNEPRKHHYVPRTLLKGFTATGEDTGTLHVIDLPRRREYQSTPAKIARETDYNRIELEGVDPFEVENRFATMIEGPAAGGLRELRRGAPPDEEQRDALLVLIAAQALRAPNRRDSYDRFTEHIRTITSALIEKADEKLTVDDPFLERVLAGHKNTATDHLGVHMPSLDALVDVLACRSWFLLPATEDADFVCTDDPVVLVPSGTFPPMMSPGFGLPDVHVFMPIGRGHGLFGQWTPEGEMPSWSMVGALDRREVAAFNTHLIWNASRFVASASSDFPWLLDGKPADRAALTKALMENRPLT